jgi:hypothetical protein
MLPLPDSKNFGVGDQVQRTAPGLFEVVSKIIYMVNQSKSVDIYPSATSVPHVIRCRIFSANLSEFDNSTALEFELFLFYCRCSFPAPFLNNEL